MSGPAKSGAFIYAKDIALISNFYQEIIGMNQVHATDELVILNASGLQVIVHKLPPEVDATVVISNPPVERAASIKLFFTVGSIAETREKVKVLKGKVHSEVWQGPGFSVCNACDPEGNIFQIRWPRP